VKRISANGQIPTVCVEPRGQDPMNNSQVFSEWVTAIWAGWQIHADRKNCSSLFPPLRCSNSFIIIIFSGYRLVNHCLGREQLSKFQSFKCCYYEHQGRRCWWDTVFLLKTDCTWMYQYICKVLYPRWFSNTFSVQSCLIVHHS